MQSLLFQTCHAHPWRAIPRRHARRAGRPVARRRGPVARGPVAEGRIARAVGRRGAVPGRGGRARRARRARWAIARWGSVARRAVARGTIGRVAVGAVARRRRSIIFRRIVLERKLGWVGACAVFLDNLRPEPCPYWLRWAQKPPF